MTAMTSRAIGSISSSVSACVNTFSRLLEAAGLPCVRFHDLRHSCATLLLAQGVPARVVIELLGHSTITLTMNTYSHVVRALQREPQTGSTQSWLPGDVGLHGWLHGGRTNAPPSRPEGRFRAQEFGEPRRTRTYNQLIKSQLLYH